MAANDPVVIVDDVYVDYKVYASGRAIRRKDRGSNLLNNKSSRAGMRIVNALKGISFVAHENESIGIIGSNGSGKTTLMRCLAGFISATSGRVYSRTQPSMLGVGAALMPMLPGSRNIMLGCLAIGVAKAEAERAYEEIVAFADLGEFIDMPLRTYSSGMSSRLRFAIAAMRNQEILIIDEALAVGDRAFRAKSEERIRQIRDAAGTVFLVSHSMNSIRETCHRVIWIEKGDMIMDGPTEEVVCAYEEFKDQGPGAVPVVAASGATETPKTAADKPGKEVKSLAAELEDSDLPDEVLKQRAIGARTKQTELASALIAKGMDLEQIAELVQLPLGEVADLS